MLIDVVADKVEVLRFIDFQLFVGCFRTLDLQCLVLTVITDGYIRNLSDDNLVANVFNLAFIIRIGYGGQDGCGIEFD